MLKNTILMTEDVTQNGYSEVNGEYPVKSTVEANSLLQNRGDFTADTLNLSEPGNNNAQALKVMDKAGWK